LVKFYTYRDGFLLNGLSHYVLFRTDRSSTIDGGVYIFEELKLSNPAMFAAVGYRHERLVVSGLTMCEYAHAFNTDYM